MRPVASARSMSDDGRTTVIDCIKSKIDASFPIAPLGSGLRELRIFVDELHNGSPALGDVTNWRDLADALARDDGAGVYLTYLKGQAWREILPAWMTAALHLADDVRRSESFLAPIIAGLDVEVSGSVGDAEDVYLDRINGLPANQRLAVGEFIRWAVSRPLLRDDAKARDLIQRLQTTWPAPQEAA